MASDVKEAEILYDPRWTGSHGIARFAERVRGAISGMTSLKTRMPLFHPLDPLVLSAQVVAARPRVYFTPGFNAPLYEKGHLVLTVHDLNYVHFAENSDSLRRAYFKYIVRPACRRAYRVLTVSEFSKDQIIAWAGIDADCVTNVGNGVEEKFSPDGPRYAPGFPYLLVVGVTGAHKNICRLIKAFGISGLSQDLKLLICGRLSDAARTLVAELKLEPRVRALGYVSEGSLPELYRGAITLCMPSLFEGFGLPVLEAMASGVPVLTSNVTSLPEVAGTAAILVDPADIESIAAGLRRIVLDEQLRSQLIVRGLARSSHFSWDRTTGLVRDVLYGAR